MIKTIIFDIGGVITKGNFQKSYSDFALRVGVSPEFVVNYHKAPQEGGKIEELVLGNITLEEFWNDIRKAGGRTDLDYEKIWIEEFLKNREINNELLEIIKELRKKYSVGTLTNLTPSRLIVDNKLDLYSHFDYAILSCNEHLKKPDPKIYYLALSKTSSQPNEAVFIDDKESHIIGAQQIGMKTITYIYPYNKKFLKELDSIINESSRDNN